ncbi:hypothetical protein CEXT_553261 [Caerostris extrusa]|uniref:Uncharacterized protein n=1 Tax=Caerostris extrusa TaxID=172846 RepID=A0AAV4VNN2_CAEEX|nr:hypothetical protein CEXT_553261 [Caerostris extrusa]
MHQQVCPWLTNGSLQSSSSLPTLDKLELINEGTKSPPIIIIRVLKTDPRSKYCTGLRLPLSWVTQNCLMILSLVVCLGSLSPSTAY